MVIYDDWEHYMDFTVCPVSPDPMVDYTGLTFNARRSKSCTVTVLAPAKTSMVNTHFVPVHARYVDQVLNFLEIIQEESK